MFGVKIEDMRETGNTIKCMVMEKYNGLMEGDMRVNTKMIKKKGKALSIGLMVENTLVDGKMENNMEKATFICKMGQ